MKHLKKVSLARRVPDDVKVSILNDREKRRLFQRELKPRQTGSLLTRLWTRIEHWPTKQRKDALKVIQALESSPSFEMNENFEMVYNGDVMGGTNILQLIKARVRPPDSGRTLLPRQDLFEHVLATAPLEVPRPSVVRKVGRYAKASSSKGGNPFFSTSPKKKGISGTPKKRGTPRKQTLRNRRWAK